jgi:hypothetical protein
MIEGSEEEIEEKMRSADEVARRCVVLYAIIAAGHEEPREQLVEWLQREGLWDAVSPQEVEFLTSNSLTRQQYVNATWRAEALFPLLWALGRVPQMPLPTSLCDVQLIRQVLPPLFESVSEFISSAQLVHESVIRDANDEIYHTHWKVRDAQLFGKPVPDGLNPGVVRERHYALNWLIGYFNQDWDDVSTDT